MNRIKTDKHIPSAPHSSCRKERLPFVPCQKESEKGRHSGKDYQLIYAWIYKLLDLRHLLFEMDAQVEIEKMTWMKCIEYKLFENPLLERKIHSRLPEHRIACSRSEVKASTFFSFGQNTAFAPGRS